MAVLEFTVSPEEAGSRLDVVVTTHIVKVHPRAAGFTRSQAQRMIEAGWIRVDGEVRPKGYRLSEGERVVVERLEEPTRPGGLHPLERYYVEGNLIEVLYADQYLAVLNKPRGLAVHHTPGSNLPALINILPEMFPALRKRRDPNRGGLVHRLDKQTSGVLVIALDVQTHQLIADQFKKRQVRKEYLAICYHTPPQAEGLVRLTLSRHPRSRKKMVPQEEGRESLTRYRFLHRWGESYSEMLFYPLTGRTHQIRVHADYLGVPIVGDELYARRYNQYLYRLLRDPGYRHAPPFIRKLVEAESFPQWSRALLESPGQLLHARRLTFLHPWKGEEMTFTAPEPEIFTLTRSLLDELYPRSDQLSREEE